MLARPRVHRVAWFTVWSSALATLLAVVLGLPAAYALHRLALPGRAAVRAAMLVPFVLPTVVVGVAFRRLLGEGGPLGFPRARRHAGGHRLRPRLLQRRRGGPHRRRRLGVARPAARSGGRRARRIAVAGAAHGDPARAASRDRRRRQRRLPLLRDGVRHRADPRRGAPRDGGDRDLPPHHDDLRPPGGRGALGAPDRRRGGPAGRGGAAASGARPDRPARRHPTPRRTPWRRPVVVATLLVLGGMLLPILTLVLGSLSVGDGWGWATTARWRPRATTRRCSCR